jgi:hypothetical protein
MCDARVQPSVALFAEMLWNPRQSDAELLARAMRPYVLAAGMSSCSWPCP